MELVLTEGEVKEILIDWARQYQAGFDAVDIKTSYNRLEKAILYKEDLPSSSEESE